MPPRRRAIGLALGGGTLMLLALSIWIISSQPPTGPGDTGLSGPAVTTFPPSTPPDPADPTTPSSSTTLPTTSTLPPTTTTLPPTTSTLTTTSTLPTTTTSSLPPIELRPDGLGAVELGAPVDEAVETVSLSLGPPDSDSGWIAADSELGTCPGTVVRVVRWDSLRTFFSDGPTEVGQDERHFFYYNQSLVETDEVAALESPEGIGLGSSVADLRRAFGDEVEIDSGLRFGARFVVDPPGPGILSGSLSDTTDAGEVTSIGGGFGCGS